VRPVKDRRALGIALLLILGALVLGVWTTAGLLTDRLPQHTLRDGSTITLEAVTLGNQEVVRGAWWRKILYFLLPAAQKPRAGCRVYRGAGGKSLLFHTRVRGVLLKRAHGTGSSQGAINSTFVTADVRDEHGCVHQPDDFEFDGAGYEALRFDAFPRRGKQVRLEIVVPDGQSERRIGFTVPNPDPGPHPSWSSDTLPVTRRDGDVTVTLARFEARPIPKDHLPFAYLEGWIHAAFRIRKGGVPAPAWGVGHWSFSTPAGDRWEPGSSTNSDYTQGIEQRLGFESNRWPDEPVWKLRVEVSPWDASPRPGAARPWSPADVWTVSGLDLPPGQRTTRVEKRGRVHGVGLELVAIAGPGSLLPGDQSNGGVDAFPVPRVLLHADWTAAGRQCEFFVFARDERGALHQVPGTLEHSDPSRTTATDDYWLHLPPRTRRIDLLVVVHPHRFVEFLVPNPFLKGKRR
jgi:hypothetical protein